MSKKRILSVICILLMSVLIIMGAGKVTRESKDYAEEFINDFYTITDYETYSYARHNPYANVYTSERLARESYGEYFTEKGMDEFIADGVYSIFEEMVYSMNRTSTLKNVTLKKTHSNNTLREFTYDFTAEVSVTDTEGHSEIVQQHGMITVSLKNDAKITSFKVIDTSSVIRAVSCLY